MGIDTTGVRTPLKNNPNWNSLVLKETTPKRLGIDIEYEDLDLIFNVFEYIDNLDKKIYRCKRFSRPCNAEEDTQAPELNVSDPISLAGYIAYFVGKSKYRFINPTNFEDVGFEAPRWMTKDRRVGLYLNGSKLEEWESFRILTVAILYLSQCVEFTVFYDIIMKILLPYGLVLDIKYIPRKYCLMTIETKK